jgi:hypothetical protein
MNEQKKNRQASEFKSFNFRAFQFKWKKQLTCLSNTWMLTWGFNSMFYTYTLEPHTNNNEIWKMKTATEMWSSTQWSSQAVHQVVTSLVRWVLVASVEWPYEVSWGCYSRSWHWQFVIEAGMWWAVCLRDPRRLWASLSWRMVSP